VTDLAVPHLSVGETDGKARCLEQRAWRALQSRCHVGVRPSSTALPSRAARKPQPSSTIRTTGVRPPRLVVILKGMQVSRIVHALPVALGLLLPGPPAWAQGLARFRVSNDGEWFYQEPMVGGSRGSRAAPS